MVKLIHCLFNVQLTYDRQSSGLASFKHLGVQFQKGLKDLKASSASLWDTTWLALRQPSSCVWHQDVVWQPWAQPHPQADDYFAEVWPGPFLDAPKSFALLSWMVVSIHFYHVFIYPATGMMKPTDLHPFWISFKAPMSLCIECYFLTD